MLAKTPDETAPWNASESVRKPTARIMSQPAYAKPNVKIPLNTKSKENCEK